MKQWVRSCRQILSALAVSICAIYTVDVCAQASTPTNTAIAIVFPDGTSQRLKLVGSTSDIPTELPDWSHGVAEAYRSTVAKIAKGDDPGGWNSMMLHNAVKSCEGAYADATQYQLALATARNTGTIVLPNGERWPLPADDSLNLEAYIQARLVEPYNSCRGLDADMRAALPKLLDRAAAKNNRWAIEATASETTDIVIAKELWLKVWRHGSRAGLNALAKIELASGDPSSRGRAYGYLWLNNTLVSQIYSNPASESQKRLRELAEKKLQRFGSPSADEISAGIALAKTLLQNQQYVMAL